MADDIDLGVLADSFAEMLGAEWPRERALAFASADEAYAAELWQAMAGLGWSALTVPEAHGGLGLGLDAAARLHAALGAAVAPAPMLGMTLAVALIARAGDADQQARWLPALAEGTIRVGFAEPGAAPLAANGAAISGSSRDVIDAGAATLLLLRARRAGLAGWLVIEADRPGVTLATEPLTDSTRSIATVTLQDVSVANGDFIAAGPEADDAVLRAGCIALAADALGAGEAALATTVEYLKVREQFGRPIGSFQALKHRVADHQAALVACRALVEHAAGLADDDGEALLAALSAKQHVTRIAAELGRDAIQLHGGVGFTAEFVPHLYLKRAKVDEALFGRRTILLDRIADLLEAA